MPYLGILGCNLEKVLSYFQNPRLCQNAKFRVKLKILNLETKNIWFWCFYAAILKKSYCQIWNQQPLICHVGVFYQCSEFWHRVHFFKRSGVRFFLRSIFSEGALYKVWYLMANTRGVLRTQSNIYDEALFRN